MRVLIFDTETTGLVDNRTVRLDRQPEMIEWSSTTIDVDSGEVHDQTTILIKPTGPIPEKVTKITGLSARELADAPPFSRVADQIVGLIEGSDLVVAHNARFDCDVVEIELERLGRTIEWPEVACTIEATAHLFGSRPSLTVLHEHLTGEKFFGAHRAGEDVAALARCVIELRKRGEFPYG